MGSPTVTDAAKGALLLQRIDGCDTQKTKLPGYTRRPVVETIKNIIPFSKGYFFFNVKYWHRFFSPHRH